MTSDEMEDAAKDTGFSIRALGRFAELVILQERTRCLGIAMDLPVLGGDGPHPENHDSQQAKVFAFDACRLIRDPELEKKWRESAKTSER